MTTRPKPITFVQVVAIVLMVLYVLLFLVRLPSWVPEFAQGFADDAHKSLFRFIRRGLDWFSLPRTNEGVVSVYFALISGVVPLMATLLMGARPHDIGCRIPNRYAWRYFLVAFVVAVPFLIWMVRSPTIAGPYVSQLQRLGFLAFALTYLVNMFTEHFFLHGVVLGLARPDLRWPADSAETKSERPSEPARSLRGMLIKASRWLGLGTAMREPPQGRMGSWLGLPQGCALPMAASAVMFGLVHLGKDVRELILAFPGGLLQAFIAYRTNSWLTPFAIHLATASLALAMMMVKEWALGS